MVLLAGDVVCMVGHVYTNDGHHGVCSVFGVYLILVSPPGLRLSIGISFGLTPSAPASTSPSSPLKGSDTTTTTTASYTLSNFLNGRGKGVLPGPPTRYAGPGEL